FGLSAAYGTSSSSGVLRTNHSISIAGLNTSTLYHFRVRSIDASGNETISGNATFTTRAPADLPSSNVSIPALAQAGAVVPLTYVISNIGPGVANGPWQNSVQMSANSDGSAAQTLGAFTFNSPGGIAPGSSLTVTQSVIVPSIGEGAR